LATVEFPESTLRVKPAKLVQIIIQERRSPLPNMNCEPFLWKLPVSIYDVNHKTGFSEYFDDESSDTDDDDVTRSYDLSESE